MSRLHEQTLGSRRSSWGLGTRRGVGSRTTWCMVAESKFPFPSTYPRPPQNTYTRRPQTHGFKIASTSVPRGRLSGQRRAFSLVLFYHCSWNCFGAGFIVYLVLYVRCLDLFSLNHRCGAASFARLVSREHTFNVSNQLHTLRLCSPLRAITKSTGGLGRRRRSCSTHRMFPPASLQNPTTINSFTQSSEEKFARGLGRGGGGRGGQGA